MSLLGRDKTVFKRRRQTAIYLLYNSLAGRKSTKMFEATFRLQPIRANYCKSLELMKQDQEPIKERRGQNLFPIVPVSVWKSVWSYGQNRMWWPDVNMALQWTGCRLKVPPSWEMKAPRRPADLMSGLPPRRGYCSDGKKGAVPEPAQRTRPGENRIQLPRSDRRSRRGRGEAAERRLSALWRSNRAHQVTRNPWHFRPNISKWSK